MITRAGCECDIPAVPVAGRLLFFPYRAPVMSLISPSLQLHRPVFRTGIGNMFEWQAPALIKPAEALVPLVSSFHNYPCNSFIIYLNKAVLWPNIHWI